MKTCALQPANVLATNVLIDELLSRGTVGLVLLVEPGTHKGDTDYVTTRFCVASKNPYNTLDALVREVYTAAHQAFGPRVSPPEGWGTTPED